MKHILSSRPLFTPLICYNLLHHRSPANSSQTVMWLCWLILRSKHSLTILYEVGRICLGNSLNRLTRGLHQLSYPQRGAYACLFSVILLCESRIWQCSHLNSNLPCNMVFKGWLGPCLIIIFSYILVIFWPHLHLVARKMLERPSCCLNNIWKCYFSICIYLFCCSTDLSWKWNWKVVWLF